MKRIRYVLLAVVVIIGIVLWSFSATPEPYFIEQIGAGVDFPTNHSIEKVRANLDTVGLRTLYENVPAQDEILLQEAQGRAFVAAMDGAIWIIDLNSQTARPFVTPPLMPAGMVAHPRDPDLIYFCASRKKPDDPVQENGPGIYQLRVSTRQVTKIGDRVPAIPDGEPAAKQSTFGTLYADGTQPRWRIDEMHAGNSRAVEKADDLAISNDGERIYFTEPYDHPGAILGVSDQSRNEALSLGRNGNIWKYDLRNGTAALVAHGYSYVDGILLEYSAAGERETALLVNELSHFRLLRLHLRGANAGQDDVVIEGLPGFPDGMDRDPAGRIWVALVVERSVLINWLHRHPFWKRFVMYIPQRYQPVSRRTALLVLSPDGGTPLYYGVHDGSRFSTLIVVIPGSELVYLAVYAPDRRGIEVMPYPSL